MLLHYSSVFSLSLIMFLKVKLLVISFQKWTVCVQYSDYSRPEKWWMDPKSLLIRILSKFWSCKRWAIKSAFKNFERVFFVIQSLKKVHCPQFTYIFTLEYMILFPKQVNICAYLLRFIHMRSHQIRTHRLVFKITQHCLMISVFTTALGFS